MTTYQIIMLLLGSGSFLTLIGFVWKVSKKDSKIDNNSFEIKELQIKMETSEKQIIDIEKDLIEIKSNQKNLIHSINNQNKQILDLIDRLEKNQKESADRQNNINEKLQSSIEAIKDSLLNIRF